jgi:hypothetical protein
MKLNYKGAFVGSTIRIFHTFFCTYLQRHIVTSIAICVSIKADIIGTMMGATDYVSGMKNSTQATASLLGALQDRGVGLMGPTLTLASCNTSVER